MYHILPLAGPKRTLYARLASPAGADLLQASAGADSVVALGASFLGRPVGVLIAELDDASGLASVRELQMLPPYHTTALGGMLLAALEDELRRRALRSIEFSYRSDDDPAMCAHALAEAGWPDPQHVYTLYELDWTLATLPWHRRSSLPPAIEIVPWAEVTAAQLEQIKRRQELGNWSTAGTSPFSTPATQVDGSWSVGLRIGDAILGWILGERIDAQTAYVAVAFVSPEVRGGAGIALMSEVARRQSAAGIRSTAINALPGSAMARAVERVMAAFLVARTAEYSSRKELYSAHLS